MLPAASVPLGFKSSDLNNARYLDVEPDLLRMMRCRARQAARRGLCEDDIFQEMRCAVLAALPAWDPNKLELTAFMSVVIHRAFVKQLVSSRSWKSNPKIMVRDEETGQMKQIPCPTVSMTELTQRSPHPTVGAAAATAEHAAVYDLDRRREFTDPGAGPEEVYEASCVLARRKTRVDAIRAALSPMHRRVLDTLLEPPAELHALGRNLGSSPFKTPVLAAYLRVPRDKVEYAIKRIRALSTSLELGVDE